MPHSAAQAPAGDLAASPGVEASVPVGLRTSRAPLPPWLWPSSGPLRRGACTRHPFLGATRVVDKGGMYKAGVAGLLHFVVCSFRLVPGPDALRHDRFGPVGQLCSVLVFLVTILLVLCSLLLTTGPRCSTSWPVRIFMASWFDSGYMSCQSTTAWIFHVFLRGSTRFLLSILVLLTCSCRHFWRRQGQDARHPGRYRPDGQLRGEILADMVVDISFMAQRQIPTVLSDHRVSPVAFLYGGRCPCLQVVQILRCCLCEDSRDPTVLLVVILVVAQMQIPLVLNH